MIDYSSKVTQPQWFAFSGPIDNTTASRFADELVTYAAKKDTRDLIVDLTGVTFMNSLGIGGLVKLKRVAEERKLPVRILIGPDIVDVFTIARLGQILEVEVVTRLEN